MTAALPPQAPAPRLLSSYDNGTWVALLLDDVDGWHPHLPWREHDLRRVVAAIDELLSDLTPCPLPDAATVGDAWREEFAGWRPAAGTTTLAGLDPWCARHLDRLADLESRWEQAAAGDTLLHLDLRADNMPPGLPTVRVFQAAQGEIALRWLQRRTGWV